MALAQVRYKESAKTPTHRRQRHALLCIAASARDSRYPQWFRPPPLRRLTDALVLRRWPGQLPRCHRRAAQGIRRLYVGTQSADQTGQRTSRRDHGLRPCPLLALGLPEQGGLRARLARPGSTIRPDRRPQLRRALPVLRSASQPADQATGATPRHPQVPALLLLSGSPCLRPDACAVADLAAVPDQGRSERPRLAGTATRCRGDRLPQEGQHLRGPRRLRACSSPARYAVAGQLADRLERVRGPVPSGARRVDARLMPGGLLLVGRAERVGHGCGIPLGGGLGDLVSPAGASWYHDIQQPGRVALPAAESPGTGWRARPLRRGGGQRPEASPRGGADQARLRA